MAKPNHINLLGGGVNENPLCAMVLGSMNKFRKNLAFTLAEVLITLGIIGIVAAMVIPSLINAYQKHVTVTRLKQTYAQITQAVKLSESENGDLSGWDMSTPHKESYDAEASENLAKKYFLPFLKYSYICDNDESYCNTVSPKYITGGSLSNGMGNYKNLYGIVLMNGVVLKFWPRKTYSVIILDINGTSGPNIIGKDVFFIVLYIGSASANIVIKGNKSGVFMYGEGHSREELLTDRYGCTKKGPYAGSYCGALIKEDGWKISKDYPW